MQHAVLLCGGTVNAFAREDVLDRFSLVRLCEWPTTHASCELGAPIIRRNSDLSYAYGSKPMCLGGEGQAQNMQTGGESACA